MSSQTNPWPPEGSKQRQFLGDLLQGHMVTVIDCMMRYNLMTPNARASELRKMGWPIRSMPVPHPELEGEIMTAYQLDLHFRNWLIENEGVHPSEYPGQDGRGKFARRNDGTAQGATKTKTGNAAQGEAEAFGEDEAPIPTQAVRRSVGRRDRGMPGTGQPKVRPATETSGDARRDEPEPAGQGQEDSGGEVVRLEVGHNAQTV